MKQRTKSKKNQSAKKALVVSLLLLAFVNSFMLQSCKDDPVESTSTTEKPVIDSVDPLLASVGANVSIYGSNLADDDKEVVVTFAGEEADITSNTGAVIVCVVPDVTIGDAAIVVTVNGNASLSYSGFEAKEALPAAIIDGFSPDNASHGETVTINGSEFGDDQDIIEVSINGVVQEITSFSDTKIQITLEEKTFSGALIVNKDGVDYTADDTYNYTITYTADDFSNLNSGILAMDSDGNVYRIHNNTLLKIDESGDSLKVIMEQTDEVALIGLFYGSNDTLYIGDGLGRILYLVPGEDVIDTLVHIGENDDLKLDHVGLISGDNEGNLYISSGSFGKGVIRYNIATKDSEIIFTAPNNESTGPMCYGNGRVYATTDYGLNSFTSEGNDIQRLVDNHPNIFRSGIVYYEAMHKLYVSGGDDEMIYSLDDDGNLSEEEATDAYCGSLVVDNDKNLLYGEGTTIKTMIIQ